MQVNLRQKDDRSCRQGRSEITKQCLDWLILIPSTYSPLLYRWRFSPARFLYDGRHEWWVEPGVQALHEAVCRQSLWKSKILWRAKINKVFEVRKAVGIDSVRNECLSWLPRKSVLRLTHLSYRYLTTCSDMFERMHKVPPPKYRFISLLPRRANF